MPKLTKKANRYGRTDIWNYKVDSLLKRNTSTRIIILYSKNNWNLEKWDDPTWNIKMKLWNQIFVEKKGYFYWIKTSKASL